MAGVFILGLVAITMLIGMMKSVLGANIGQVLAFAMLSFLIMLLLEGVFLRLLFRRKRGPKEAGDTGQLKQQATRELDAAQARVLPEHMSSVTEHTTRAFDPTYPERRSK
jgi:membrane protein implicated in regulation of membrane protease activity